VPLRKLEDSTHFLGSYFWGGGRGENEPQFLRDGKSNYIEFSQEWKTYTVSQKFRFAVKKLN